MAILGKVLLDLLLDSRKQKMIAYYIDIAHIFSNISKVPIKNTKSYII